MSADVKCCGLEGPQEPGDGAGDTIYYRVTKEGPSNKALVSRDLKEG